MMIGLIYCTSQSLCEDVGDENLLKISSKKMEIDRMDPMFEGDLPVQVKCGGELTSKVLTARVLKGLQTSLNRQRENILLFEVCMVSEWNQYIEDKFIISSVTQIAYF